LHVERKTEPSLSRLAATRLLLFACDKSLEWLSVKIT